MDFLRRRAADALDSKAGTFVSSPGESDSSSVGQVRRLAQYRPFERGGLDLRAVLHDLALTVGAIEGGPIGPRWSVERPFSTVGAWRSRSRSSCRSSKLS